MKCPECGNDNIEGEVYCLECGAVLGDETIIAHGESDVNNDLQASLFVDDKEIVIEKGENVVGRESADIIIEDPDEYVSRKHCVIYFDDNTLSVIDCSLNGTFVNGEKAFKDTKIEINDGDELRFAKIKGTVKLK